MKPRFSTERYGNIEYFVVSLQSTAYFDIGICLKFGHYNIINLLRKIFFSLKTSLIS